MFGKQGVLALSLCASCASVAAIDLLPAPSDTRVVDLTPEPGYFNEPSIAVNAVNPNELVAAFQVNARAAYSVDGGAHWTEAEGTAPADYARSGDVSITYDRHGHAILCYIAFDKLGTPNYWAHNATRNGIFVRRSLDGGRTWETQASAVLAQPTQPGIPFEDKPYIVADNTGGRFTGNLYVGWTEFRLNESVIYFSRSTDDGQTWSAPVTISDHRGLPRDDNGSVEGFSGAVLPDGTLAVVWSDGSHLVFTRSTDGGRSFERTRYIADTAPSYFQVNAVERSNGFPVIAADAGGEGRRARLYAEWSDYRNGDVDVFCISSSDAGRHWTQPVRVNSDALHNGADQFFPWLAVDRGSGAVNIVFYDRRRDPKNRDAIVVLARSTDQGRTFRNYVVSGNAFNPQDAFLGDYTGVAAYSGKVYAIWSEQVVRSADAASEKRHNTIVRVGITDFNGYAEREPAQSGR